MKITYSMSSTHPHTSMRTPMRKHTSPHRTPHLFIRMATSKDAIRSIEYNSTILAVFGSKSTGISPDRDVLVRFIARGNTNPV